MGRGCFISPECMMLCPSLPPLPPPSPPMSRHPSSHPPSLSPLLSRLSSPSSPAGTFLSGSVRWTKVGDNQARFDVVTYWRRSFSPFNNGMSQRGDDIDIIAQSTVRSALLAPPLHLHLLLCPLPVPIPSILLPPSLSLPPSLIAPILLSIFLSSSARPDRWRFCSARPWVLVGFGCCVVLC